MFPGPADFYRRTAQRSRLRNTLFAVLGVIEQSEGRIVVSFVTRETVGRRKTDRVSAYMRVAE